MNKEEILSKAQHEPDEMEYAVTEKALGISTIVIPILCLIFIILRIVNNEYIISDLLLLILAQILIQQIYQYIKMREKKNLIFVILTSSFIIVDIVLFLKEVTLWMIH